MSGLGILMEEKDNESYKSESHDSLEVGAEALLPPLPPSSSSLPLKETVEPGIPMESGAEKGIVREKSMRLSSGIHVESQQQEQQLSLVQSHQLSQPHTPKTPQQPQMHKKSASDQQSPLHIITQPQENPQNLISPLQASHLATSSISSKEIVSHHHKTLSNLQSQDNSTVNSTRQGSVSSIASTTSTSSSKAVMKGIKSGLKKISSLLSSTPKQEQGFYFEGDSDEAQSTKQLFKRPFLPRHVSNLSNASNSSSVSSLGNGKQHSHSNSTESNRTTESMNRISTTPMTSPIIAINEKFRAGTVTLSPTSEYQFPTIVSGAKTQNEPHTATIVDLDNFDTIDDKLHYIDSLKKQLENEEAAYKLTERRLISSGWSSEAEIDELTKKRLAVMKQWKQNIDLLEASLYRYDQ